MRAVATILVCAAALAGQPSREQRRTSSRTADSEKGAWVLGSVVSDQTGQPLERAQVILRPVAGATNSVLVETDEHGNFIINRINPGTYSLLAQREGFLPNGNARRGPLRLPPLVKLTDGVRLRDLTFRLRPWAVIAGKVRYDNAEPAVGALVQLYREVVSRGRHSMQLVQSARVNDRGEYRVHGLSPGAYLVAATRSRPVSPDLEEQEAIDESGRPKTEYRYATTFYPAAQKLSDAAAVRVESGQEVGAIDIYLKPVPAVRIKGTAVNGITGLKLTQPNVVFRRMSADGNSSISVSTTPKFTNEGFEITGITSGPYLVTCDIEHEGRRLFSRVFINVTDAPIEDLYLLLEPEREMEGVIRFDDSPTVSPSRLRVSLEPRSDLNPARAAEVLDSGRFRIKVIPGEHYDAYVGNLPPQYYIKSVRIGNVDVGPEGISGLSAAPNVPLELTLSAKSGTVSGRAYTPEGTAAGAAALVLVPDPARGQAAKYIAGTADEYGVFVIRGVPPGRYTVFAQYDNPPCDYYDEAALASCRSYGRTVDVAESGQTNLEVRVQ